MNEQTNQNNTNNTKEVSNFFVKWTRFFVDK